MSDRTPEPPADPVDQPVETPSGASPESAEAGATRSGGRSEGQLRLGRLFGFEIEAHVALLPLLVVVAVVLATSLLPGQEEGTYGAVAYGLMGLAGALLLVASVLAHELAHALTARAQGLRVERVPVFFHASRVEDGAEPESPGAEFLIAAIGPATSIALGGLAWGLALGLPDIRGLSPLLRFTGVINLLLGFASLLPAFPLDGGRMLRALFWRLSGTRLQGTRLACIAGSVLAGVLLAAALLQLLAGAFGPGALWCLALAVLLHYQSGLTWRRTRLREGLAGLTVGDLLGPLPPVLPRQASVEEALFDPAFASQREGGRSFFVDFHGRLGGLVTLRALRGVPEDERATTPVWQVTKRLRREHLLSPAARAEGALARLREAGLPLLPVLHQGQLIGTLSREAIQEAVDRVVAGRPLPARNPEPSAP